MPLGAKTPCPAPFKRHKMTKSQPPPGQSSLQRTPTNHAPNRNPHSHSHQQQRFVLRTLSDAQKHPKPFTIADGRVWVYWGRKRTFKRQLGPSMNSLDHACLSQTIRFSTPRDPWAKRLLLCNGGRQREAPPWLIPLAKEPLKEWRSILAWLPIRGMAIALPG